MAGQTQAIPKDWKETTLGEVVEKIIDNRGKTPLFNLEKGYKLIETWQISIDSKYPTTEKNKQKFVDKQTYNQWFRSGHPQNGDILFSTVGESVPQFCFAPEEERICIAQNLIGIRTNRNLVDAPFLLSLFKTRKFILSVKNRLIITAQPSIKVPHLLGVEIILPPLPEQYAIASVLSSLDDKIELLHEQNKTLEATTQAIFTEWFTIPLKGWKVRRLGEVTRVVGGTTPSTKNAKFWNGGIHWTSPKDLSNSRDLFLLNTEKKITTKGLAQISSGLLPKGTLLLSSRAPIGYLAITNIELAINQGYIALLPDS